MRDTLILTLLLAPFSAPHALGYEPACTNGSLHGSYTFVAHGTTLPGFGLTIPLGAFSSSGTAEFDGKGHFSLTAISSFAGTVIPASTVTGTYGVNADCSYTSQATNGVTFRAVIVEGGHELLILQTTPGVAITGVALSDGKGVREYADDETGCGAQTFSGMYGFLADGFAGAPILPSAPFAPLTAVGTADVRRNGTFSMLAQRSVNGVLDPTPLPLTGTYKFTASCTVELTFDAGFHFTGHQVNSNEAFFIETDPGAALTFRSRRITDDVR